MRIKGFARTIRANVRARNVGLSRENLGQAPDSVRTRVARPLGGGNYAMQGCDTPATRRQSASHGAKPPPATGLEGAGGSGGPEGLTAVPGGGEGAWLQYPQTTAAPSPSKFCMQFPYDMDRCTLKNRRISTIRLQHLKYAQGNCMRN